MSLAAFDLDGTLLTHNSSFSFCRYLLSKGLLSRADLLYCSSIYTSHLLFGLSLWTLHRCVFKRLFQGKSVEALSVHLDSFLPTLNWYPPALERLNQLRSQGVEIQILSNSARFLVEPIAASIGVERVFATDYTIDKQGCLWDIASLVDGKAKSRLVCMNGKETTAFSDSHHDLPFLEAADRSVVVNPTKRLSKIALKRGWERI